MTGNRKKKPASGLQLMILIICISIFSLWIPASDSFALEINKYTAPNGLLVVQVEQHSLPIVMATLLIKASPLNEDPAKAGLAYITAKMLTEGTLSKSAAEINEGIEFLGASLESSANYDYSAVSLSVLKKDVDKAFDLFSDAVLHPAFREEDLGRQKNLIIGGLKQKEEETSFIANRTFIKEVFGSHAYGRLLEGEASTLQRLNRGDLADFYRAHFLPGNAILSVVGDLTPTELDALIKKYFSSWQSVGARQSSRKFVDEHTASENKGTESVIIDRPVTQANIIIGLKGIARDNPDYYAATVMNYILGGGGFASRLMHIIRDQMGLAYNIQSYFAANKEPGPFEIFAQTKNESAGTVIEETMRQIKKIRSEPVSEKELSDAKAYLTGSFPRKLETSRQVADLAGSIQFYELGDNYIREYPSYINKVTSEDVLRVARKYLDAEHLVLVVVGDKKKMLIPDF